LDNDVLEVLLGSGIGDAALGEGRLRTYMPRTLAVCALLAFSLFRHAFNFPSILQSLLLSIKASGYFDT